MTPSNPFGLPGSSNGFGTSSLDSAVISGFTFPNIFSAVPNLKVDYSYTFGPKVRVGVGKVDYVAPIRLGEAGVAFGQFHSELYGFMQRDDTGIKGSFGLGAENKRWDVSIGGGYRKALRDGSFVGINGFSDNAYVGQQWFSSGGVGAELYALVPGNGLIDLSFNYYGNMLTREEYINAFRNGPRNCDLEVGYSQPLFNQAVDLRVKGTWYQFDIGAKIHGGRFGVGLTTRDGVFSAHYDYGSDQINGSYNTVGASVNVGFDLAKLANLESPFSAPAPVFNSPRTLNRSLNQGVKRNWHQPSAILQQQAGRARNGAVDRGRPVTLTSTPGLAIPDAADLSGAHPGAPVLNTISVSGGPIAISKITVTLNITHTFVSDLRISLMSPSGTAIFLWKEEDGGGDNIFSTFDDSAATPITTVTTGMAPFVGTFRPRDPLSSFNGLNANGLWTLTVQDFYLDDVGTLNSWTLHIE